MDFIRRSRDLSVLSYAVVMICIGLPVWWHTTDVVRFPLPFNEIEIIGRTNVKQVAKIHIITGQEAKFSPDCIQDSPVYAIKVSTRAPTQSEDEALSNSPSMSVLDERLNNIYSSRGDVSGQIFAYHITNSLSSTNEDLQLGRHRAVFFSGSTDETSLCNLVQSIRESVLGEEEVDHMMRSIVAPQHEKETERSQQLSQWSKVKATPALEYDILLTLLIPEPHLRKVKWDMPSAVKKYLNPFLDQISNIYSFDVKSQVLYLTSLGLSATQLMTDQRSGKVGNAIRQEDLGLAINMESKLISHVSSRLSFNFLAYVPTEAQTPLHIKADQQGTFLSTNAFVVPRWGGVSIWNMDLDSNQTVHYIGDKELMSVVTTQLRSLLGLKQREGQTALAEWEKDFLLRMRLFENLMTSRVTLTSLADLLSKISNIVITEDVAEKVLKAVNAYQLSVGCLAMGQVCSCFEFSKVSFKSSEEVFFDNSLLALLYFPEDQKYAIYVPLFLPILFSFVTALMPVVKELKEKIISSKAKQS